MSSPFGTHQSTGIWCRIAGGKVVRKAEETTPGAVKVEVKKNGVPTGEFRWELHDDFVLGKIIAFERKSQTFANEEINTLIVKLLHGDAKVNVQFTEGGRYWRAFMYRLPNINLTLPMKIAPYDFIPQGETKNKIGLTVTQDETKIPAAFTKESPGGMPDAQTVVFKGKDRLDFTAQDKWLNDIVLLPVNQKLAAITNTAAAPAAVAEDDDLPF